MEYRSLVTTIFDKPATPDGPTFEEALLVTPSLLPAPVADGCMSRGGRRIGHHGLAAAMDSRRSSW
jgi:hypothetical protein